MMYASTITMQTMNLYIIYTFHGYYADYESLYLSMDAMQRINL